MTEPDSGATEPVIEQPTAVLSAPEKIFVGGYTEEMGGGAPGLSMFVPTTGGDGDDPDTSGATTDPAGFSRLAAVGLQSPTYLIRHPDQPWIFAVHESSPGQVSAIRYDDEGVHLINTVESGGDGGCHLCFDHTGGFVIVAHYTSGSIASFRIEDNGALSDRIGLLEFSGSGPDADRQDASHAHQVVSVGESILVPDLGADAIHIVRIDAEGNLSPAADSVSLPPGSGPRHLVLAGRHLVVACELSATLWVSALDAEVGSAGTTVPTSARQIEDRIYPSAIGQFGDQIVVANRGADSIAIFTLDAYGTPHPLVEIDSGGGWPRDLTVDGDQIWVANQAADNVTVIRPTAVSNNPEDWQTVLRLPTPSPACVLPTS
jgi:6-phosphogluconolactonase (cycloisomerase 2 family)